MDDNAKLRAKFEDILNEGSISNANSTIYEQTNMNVSHANNHANNNKTNMNTLFSENKQTFIAIGIIAILIILVTLYFVNCNTEQHQKKFQHQDTYNTYSEFNKKELIQPTTEVEDDENYEQIVDLGETQKNKYNDPLFQEF